jgi:hypothetical protein
MSVTVEVNALVFGFRSRSSNGTDWKTLEQRVRLTWKSCQFGGARPWFICQCGCRSALLYLAGTNLFACRKCCGLTYKSRQESPCDRALRKAQKINARLGHPVGITSNFKKPKHMHWHTYERLVEEAATAEARAYELLRV